MGLVVLAGITMASCGGKSDKELALESTLDSLSMTDSLHKEDITSMTEFISTLSDGLDSINGQESDLKNLGVEGKKLDKEHFRKQLAAIKETIKNQKSKIAQLQKKVANNNSAYGQKIKKLIEYYKAQLDEKDAQIADLQKQIDDKNTNIAELTENVNKLTATNTSLNETIDTQKSEIAQQDETIHEAWVNISSAKSLKAQGLLTGGFLAKKKIDVSKLNNSSFTKIDVRKYNDITLESKNPKVMTQMPANSYRIDQNSNGTCTLHILDVEKFWSVSKYLVVKL